VIVIGQQPFGFSEPLSAPPYQFTTQVPKRIDPRKYLLSADCFTTPGQDASDSITIQTSILPRVAALPTPQVHQASLPSRRTCSVTAVALGSAKVVIKYGKVKSEVPVSVNF
jgi:hypothetical protein